MGKKGKNKTQTLNVENTPKVESVQVNNDKEEKKPVEPMVTPKSEPKGEEIKAEPPKIEQNGNTENGAEENEEMSKSKKRRNRKKKSELKFNEQLIFKTI